MKQTIERDSEEWKIFTRVWQLFQDYAIPEKNEEYWDALLAEQVSIEKEFNKHPLAVWLAYGVAMALNDKAKENNDKT